MFTPSILTCCVAIVYCLFLLSTTTSNNLQVSALADEPPRDSQHHVANKKDER